MGKVEQVCRMAKQRVRPGRELEVIVNKKAEQIRAAVDRECKSAGVLAEVRIDGSVAKGTWLRHSADADIFMRVSPDLSKEQLRNVCLPIGRRALAPNEIVERYAEHPYVESMVRLHGKEWLRVNVVPCYSVQQGHWLSATDRSPFHTEYVRRHLKKQQRDDVRLLKAFLKAIGGYGADTKTGGFSGMLCETLVMSHGSFLNVIREFSKWQGSRFVDLEDYYRGRSDEVHRIFREPLIVIDPVDEGRNLAAAVRKEQLWNFVAAARRLLAKPSATLFQEPSVKPISLADFRRTVGRRGPVLLAVVLGRMDVVVDILWSQLYKTERAITTLLTTNGFSVTRSASWSDEQSTSIILLELQQAELPRSKVHHGPPVSRVKESASFLAKHVPDKRTLAGPWIVADRWAVEKVRETNSAIKLLKSSLRDGGRSVGVASEPARLFKRKVGILDDAGIEKLIRKEPDFAGAVRIFLSGRARWLA